MILNRELISLFIATITINLAANLIGPFFPLYFQSLGASLVMAGLLVSTINLIQMILRIPGGLIADRFEEKKVFILCLVLSLVPPVALLFATSWQQTVPWVALYAVPLSLFLPVWNVTVANNSEAQQRARVFSIMNMAWPIGVIIGPMIGGFISDSLGWSAMMSALIVTYICGLVPVLFTAPHERVHERMSFQRMSFQIDRSIIKPLLFYSFFQFFVGMGFGLTNTILPTYVTDILGMTKETIGIFWSICFGVTFLATQIPGGRLAERFHLRKILILGVALAPLFIITIPSTRSILVFEALYTAMTTLWNLSVPAGNVLFLSLLPNDRRGFYTGVMQTIAMASWTVAPSIGTFLYDFYGPALPFYASAISFILATITLIGVKENKVDR